MKVNLRFNNAKFKSVFDKRFPVPVRTRDRGKLLRSAPRTARVKNTKPPVSSITSMDAVWDRTANGIIVVNSARKIVMTNPAARRLAQIDPEGMPINLAPSVWGKMLDLNGHEIEAHEWPLEKAIRGEPTTQQPCQLVQVNGNCYDILFTAVPMELGDGTAPGAVATLTDITAHNKRTQLARQLAVSRERRRMAEDIHDVLCQKLHAIALQLEAAQECFERDRESVLQRLKTAYDVARESLKEARRSMWTFCHESFGDVDPAAALSEVASQIVHGTPISLDLSLQQQPRELPPKIPLELVRITQEALSNVIKHANANRVRVELAYKRDDLHFCVQDDGRGFVRNRTGRLPGGFGLISMQERAERMGGKMSVDSQPGRGTRVAAVIPLPAAAA